MHAAKSIIHGADCLLDPVAIIHLFLTQVLHGNTAINHLVRISGLSFTGSAYCQARSRLPVALFEVLLRRVTERLGPQIDETATWHGHRVFVADGSSFTMPDVPELQKHFGQPSVQQPGCGFPVGPSSGVVPRRHGDAREGPDRTVVHTRHVRGGEDPSRTSQ